MSTPESEREFIATFNEMITIEFNHFIGMIREFNPNSATASAAYDPENIVQGSVGGAGVDRRWSELANLSFVQNPAPVLAALRTEGPAIIIGEFEGIPIWLVTRYADARTVLSHPEISSDASKSPAHIGQNDENLHSRNLPLSMADSRHVELRPLISSVLTPTRIEALKVHIVRNAERFLDELPNDRPVDLIHEYLARINTNTLVTLLGIPDDMGSGFLAWTDQLNFHMLDPDAAKAAGPALYGFCYQLLDRKIQAPGDDAVTELIRARDAGALNDWELIGILALLLQAGQEGHFLAANSLLTLLSHPDQLAELLADLDRLPGCLNELVRHSGPLQLTLPRHTNAPIELDGVTIPADQFVLVSLAAVNRDPARFPDPDRLDISHRATGHLAFGHGVHRCVGAELGKIQTEIALRILLDRYPGVCLTDHQPLRPNMFLRHPKSMPVILSP